MNKNSTLIEFDNISTLEKFRSEPDFLTQLGMIVYNWSRIETLLATGLRLRTDGARSKNRDRPIPIHFSKKLELWKELHKTLPGLSIDKKEAVSLAGAAKNLSSFREGLIHGGWEDVVSVDPFSVRVRSISEKNGLRKTSTQDWSIENIRILNTVLEHHACSWAGIIFNLRGVDLDKYRESPLPQDWMEIRHLQPNRR